MVNRHLQSSAYAIDRDKVRDMFEKLINLVDEIGFQ